jgi:hypothetical protein
LNIGRLLTNESLVVANADSHGFYRVLYAPEIYKELSKQLRLDHHEISTIERASVMNDMFAFLKSGHLNVDVLFDLIQYVSGNH